MYVTKKFLWNIPKEFVQLYRDKQNFKLCVGGIERVKFIKFYLFLESSHIYHHHTPLLRNPSSSVIRLREKLLLLSFPPSILAIHFKPFPALPSVLFHIWVYVLFVIIFTVLRNNFRRGIPHTTRDLLFLCSLRDYISFRLGDAR